MTQRRVSLNDVLCWYIMLQSFNLVTNDLGLCWTVYDQTSWVTDQLILFTVGLYDVLLSCAGSVVVKDLRLKDKDKDKDLMSKDEDKDEDLSFEDKDKDKDLGRN